MKNFKPVVNVEETFGDMLFLRAETGWKYEDGQKTDTVDHVKVYVLSQGQKQEIQIKVDTGHEPKLEYMTPVVFENVELTPYVKTNGNFSTIDWSIKAEKIAKA